jgi:hypothetical protein
VLETVYYGRANEDEIVLHWNRDKLVRKYTRCYLPRDRLAAFDVEMQCRVLCERLYVPTAMINVPCVAALEFVGYSTSCLLQVPR